ncbi:differentially expressed in FDCP 6 homolog [Gracilinanus agilis]|nr:differentially expressed in FDCP 6 homolog [Gracilinanus agilis]
MSRLMHPIRPGDKRPPNSSSFPGFQPSLLARRDSSLKLLSRWGSRDSETPATNSCELQESLHKEDESSTLASTSQEEQEFNLEPPN